MADKVTIKKLWEIFITFFKVGCFTFGGGYAMISIIEKEIITKKKWINEKDMIDVFAISQSLPGAIAINSSTFVGYKIAGWKGAFLATVGVIMPSFIIITSIAAFFAKFQDNPIVKAAFLGVRSAVAGLILLAAIKIGKTAVKDKVTTMILSLTIVLILVLDIHAIFIIIGGALVGLGIYILLPNSAKKIVERVEKSK